MTVLRLSALVIVLVTAIGLYKKAWLPEKHCIRAGFFVYYTHLSNLLILLYELALGASGHDPHCGAFRWLSSPGVALSMTLCIYVTHLIYAFVLLPTAHRRDDESWLKGRFSFGNVCVHFITPGLTVLQWLLWQDKAGLTVGHAVWWLVLPLAYFAFAMLRAGTGKPIGRTGQLYPYPFLDYPRLGAGRFWLYATAILTFSLDWGVCLWESGIYWHRASCMSNGPLLFSVRCTAKKDRRRAVFFHANKFQGQASGGGQATSMGLPVTGCVSASRVDHRAGEQSALLP